MFYRVYAAVIVFLAGLMIGSFDNVAIYRLPEGKSLVAPRSFCPKCGVQIAWYDNLPLLSYALLRGRCRHCGQSISARYPLVELLSGLLFLAVFADAGFSWAPELIPYFFMITVLIIVSAIDIQNQIIPNKVIYPAIPIAFVAMGAVALARGDAGIMLRSIIGFAIGGIPLAIIALIIPKGMGMGDAKLAAFTGIFLGYYQLLGYFFAFLLGSLVGAALMIGGKKGRKSRIPFGPFLAAGALIALFWGPAIYEWYRTLF